MLAYYTNRLELHRGRLAVTYSAYDAVRKRPVVIKAYDKRLLDCTLLEAVMLEIEVLLNVSSKHTAKLLCAFDDV